MNDTYWQDQIDYIDLLLYIKHNTMSRIIIDPDSNEEIPPNTRVVIQNIGVRGALKEAIKKRTHWLRRKG